MEPLTPRSDGEWLYRNAETTGDWHSAAIALRQDVQRLAADKEALVLALELAWSLAGGVEPDPLEAFPAEVLD